MPITSEADFHKEIHNVVGSPTSKVVHTGHHKNRRTKFVSKEHAADWAKSKVDLGAKTVTVEVYMDFQQNSLNSADYNKLKSLASAGIKTYWGRQINVGDDKFIVSVDVFHRVNNSIDVDLYVADSTDYKRSHNSGLIDASFVYNKGFYRGWNNQGDTDFMMVAAHEFGHSVLEYFGGTGLSWTHKGSTNKIMQNVKSSTPGYPPSGEIDLMKYYDADKHAVSRSDRRMRTLAEEQDVKRLVWLSNITF
jgi:hypothetical protein